MGPRRCGGYIDGTELVDCCFNSHVPRKHAQGMYDGKCTWCSPNRLRIVCGDPRLRKLAACNLAGLRRLDETVYQLAATRAAEHPGGDELVDYAEVVYVQQMQRQAPADHPRAEGHGRLDDVEMEAAERPAAQRRVRQRPAAALAPSNRVGDEDGDGDAAGRGNESNTDDERDAGPPIPLDQVPISPYVGPDEPDAEDMRSGTPTPVPRG